VVTVENHRLKTGHRVRITDVIGNTNANGDFVIRRVDDNSFELVDSNGNGNFATSPMARMRLISGLNPREKPGGQGGIHLSILADIDDPFVVYIGGDRQERDFPNSLTATDFSGRLFRGDASIPALGANVSVTVGVTGSQWSPLTHLGTLSNSSPHADSREMAFDANGDLIESDDGGVYRRVAPFTGTVQNSVKIGSAVVVQSRNHGLSTGDEIRITGVVADPQAPRFAKNTQTFTVTVLSPDEFQLDGATNADEFKDGIWGAGDWSSLNSSLQITEFHDIAWDTVSSIIIGGAQDVGTPQQSPLLPPLVWDSISNADGGDVAVDTRSLNPPGTAIPDRRSIRYSSFQNLGKFTRRTYDASGNLQKTESVDLSNKINGSVNIGPAVAIDSLQPGAVIAITATGHGLPDGATVRISGVQGTTGANGEFKVFLVDENIFLLDGPDDNTAYNGGGMVQRINPSIKGQFITPVVLNANDPRRMVLAGSNSVFESSNKGDTILEILPGSEAQNAIAYGDFPGGLNPDVLYVGVDNELLFRFQAGQLAAVVPGYPGGEIRDVVLDPKSPTTAWVIDADGVFHVRNADTMNPQWTTFTPDLGAGGNYSLEFIPGSFSNVLAIGTATGVFVQRVSPATGAALGDPIEFGTNLPNARVSDLDFDEEDQLLIAGTLGRGAWILTNTSVPPGQPVELFDVPAGTGDVARVDLSQITGSATFNMSLNAASLPEAAETLTMVPKTPQPGFDLQASGESIGTLLFSDEVTGQPFAQTGQF
jgi:hypothetical protein